MRATNRLKTNKQKSQSVHAKEVAPQCSDLHISLTSKSQVWSWEETEFPLGLRQEGHPTFKKKVCQMKHAELPAVMTPRE